MAKTTVSASCDCNTTAGCSLTSTPDSRSRSVVVPDAGAGSLVAGRAWIKLYERWLTSPRHAHLSGDVLGTGALLLLVAEAMGEEDAQGTRWLLCSDGVPVTLATCHRHVRVRSESGRRRVKKLIECGTMVLRDDGCIGFANYRQWQEKPGAERVRKHRAKRYDGVTGNVTRNGEAEAEAEAEAEVTPSPTPPERESPVRTQGKPPSHDHRLNLAFAIAKEALLYGVPGDDRGPPTVNGQRMRAVPGLLMGILSVHLGEIEPKAAAEAVVDMLHGCADRIADGDLERAKWSATYLFNEKAYWVEETRTLAWREKREREERAKQEREREREAREQPERTNGESTQRARDLIADIFGGKRDAAEHE